MPGDRYFLDTNILVYANDASDPAKQAAAVKLIGEGLRSGRGVISTQVLGEFWVTVTRKIAVPLDGETAEAEIAKFEAFKIVSIGYDAVKSAIAKQKDYRLSYWDALILSAAELGGCETVYSEDLSSGRTYGGISVADPFRRA